ncbi:MAG: hypothetical protein ACRCXT_19645 [Paraclostridium sp.]
MIASIADCKIAFNTFLEITKAFCVVPSHSFILKTPFGILNVLPIRFVNCVV